MAAHRVSRTFRVMPADRTGDRLVFAPRNPPVRHSVIPIEEREPVMAVQVVDCLEKESVPAGPGDGLVECRIGAHERDIVYWPSLGSLRVHGGEAGSESREFRRRALRRRQFRRRRFEQKPNLIELLERCAVQQAGRIETAVGCALDEPVAFQPGERLTHRRRGNAEPHGQHIDRHAAAGRDLLVEDHAFQRRIGAREERTFVQAMVDMLRRVGDGGRQP